ncbi:hypothetical protein [Sphingobium sp. YR768]|uniref:hypothetical protein n=1 Tax=Sphingobium sp. YR768 TaxID=1884365 RepID=UPI00115F84B6|nr:hypothetical protein [Sphingobium sp. YR768]
MTDADPLPKPVLAFLKKDVAQLTPYERWDAFCWLQANLPDLWIAITGDAVDPTISAWRN